MTPRKKTELERIKALWYKRLKDEGFVDIEQENGTANIGFPRSADYANLEQREIVQEYYNMAYHFLNSYQFDSEIEKVMWEYYTNGLSVREISKLLAANKIHKVSKNTVWRAVKRLETLMKGLYLLP